MSKIKNREELLKEKEESMKNFYNFCWKFKHNSFEYHCTSKGYLWNSKIEACINHERDRACRFF